MIPTFVVRLVLLLLALLVVVPAATSGGVAVRRGGFFRGVLSLFVVGLLDLVLWSGFALFTLGGAVIANILLCGLIGIFVNACAFWVAGRLMPDTLQVRNFGSACWAATIMTVVTFLINHVSFI